MNTQQVKAIIGNVDSSASMDDLILGKDTLVTLMGGYDELGIDAPEWVYDGVTLLSNEINNRNKAELERQLKRAEAEEQSLMTVGEKRAAAKARVAELKKKLGK